MTVSSIQLQSLSADDVLASHLREARQLIASKRKPARKPLIP